MTDVSKALLLPDLATPSFGALCNLSMYWDEIIVTDYQDSVARDPIDERLVDEGVVRVIEREIPPSAIFSAGTGTSLDGDLEGFRVGTDEFGHLSVVELVTDRSTLADDRKFVPLVDRSDAELEPLAAISLIEHLGRLDDSLAIAASNNLAPVSHSLGGHLAAVVGGSRLESDSIATREAALLSIAADVFALNSETSLEEVLSFRSKSSLARARLRAGLIDLSEALRFDGDPAALLAQARDTFRNRVEPALGDLEEVLKENDVKFFMKSLMGATAVVLAPIEPVSAVVGGATMVGQSIDFSFSKSRLLREHPYGYLHEVSDFAAATGSSERPDFELTMSSPRESLWKLWLEVWRSNRELVREFRESLIRDQASSPPSGTPSIR